jgi:hypothetical protein
MGKKKKSLELLILYSKFSICMKIVLVGELLAVQLLSNLNFVTSCNQCDPSDSVMYREASCTEI